MADLVMIDLRQLARGLDTPLRQIQAAVELLDEGNTVPFITRYRKDQTGGLDEEQIREIQGRLTKLRLLADRKQTILRSIQSQGKLTDALSEQILAATTTKRLEDLYLPYKPKKVSLASLARCRGLEALAREILEAAPSCTDLDARAVEFVSVDRQVPTAADALLGAGHILAEQFSEQVELRGRLREVLQRSGVLVSCRLSGEEKTEKLPSPAGRGAGGEGGGESPPSEIATTTEAHGLQPVGLQQPPTATLTPAAQRRLVRQQAKEALRKKRDLKRKKLEEKRIKDFAGYFDYREELRRIPPHRVLAINRGERAKVLRVRIESDLQAMVNLVDETLVPPGHPHAGYLRGCARDALSRLILPGLEREVRRELTDRAETHAVGVFAKNLRNLLLQPPVHNHRLLAVDPGFRSGCKLAALDQFGNLLGHDVIYLVGKPDRRGEARQKVLDLLRQHQLTVMVVGNGTACRPTEDFFAELIEKELKDQGVAYVIVNEAGASVYSTSRLGREEFPQYDAVLRGAISIGRRLQDPLSELVKIDPASIGVGLYQHDVKAKHLRTSLDDVVESCVNYVGVEVNTASPALLRYVSGLNQLTARRLYEYRREHGPFRNRAQFREVPGFGEATFVQAAGFLKILDGDNPLDATWIHPESYPVANKALERLHGAAADLRDKNTVAALAEPIVQLDLEAAAKDLQVGLLTLKDILAQLARPGRDPREDLPAPVFKRGVVKLEDLAPGMELTGTVLNVVDFGCFIDIGLHQSGLVHVSRLADKYVRDPHDVVAVGDIVKVWVTEIDKERHRVSLTMIRPGSEQPKHPRGHRRGTTRSVVAVVGGKHHKGASGGRPPQEAAADGRPPDKAAAGDRPPDKAAAGDRPPRPAGQHRRADQQRPPRPAGEGRPPRPHGRGRPQHDYQRPPPRPRPTPRPLIPITDAMKAGKEPLRTFSDLMQFYQQKPAAANDGQQSAPVEQPPAVTAEPAASAAPPPVARVEPAAAEVAPPAAKEESPAVAADAPTAPEQG